ncbi:CoA transferase [uncultured Hydrogenophaga sp.]|uniref:CaiB/BaiF CoA transferase family protein n=1 Tax=uncultured Hydrogenophaga sp. TaxID=199683 RepID=UPI00258AB296|nr:CoA transferase [uncultured Hydrogenophaga sp.]
MNRDNSAPRGCASLPLRSTETHLAGRPLQGVRVVEMGSVVLAPYAAQLLADMGAEVIKIEPPKGDITRNQGYARHPGMAALYLSCNRGKRSLVLDAKQPAGLEALRRVVASADVFLHNMRADSAERLGVDYAQVNALNPRLVYCCTYGFGASGRYRARPAYDDIIQAISGAAGLAQMISSTPGYMPTIVADKTTALFVVIGIQSALLRRATTGVGEQIEVAMFETMAHYLSVEHLAGHAFDPPMGPVGYRRMVSHHRKPHRTSDGFIAVMPHSERDWRVFFDACGIPEFMDDPRFIGNANRAAHINELYAKLADLMPSRSTAEWARFLDDHDIPNAVINTLDGLKSDPHMQDVGFWHAIEHPSEGQLVAPSFPVRYGGPGGDARPALVAPRFGQHSREVLAELGYDAPQIDDLVVSGVVLTNWPATR